MTSRRLEQLETRVRELEDERLRIFSDAQREADTVFAQYQMSQLLAAGGTVEEIAPAILAEVARAADASDAVLWLARPGSRTIDLVATFGADPDPDAGALQETYPGSFVDADAGAAWAAARGWSGITLPEGRSLGADVPGEGVGSVGFLAVRADPAEPHPDRFRYLVGVRQELAVTLRAAQLRASLASEQAMLAAILDDAMDAIVAVDARRRVVRLNAAAAALVGTPARFGTGMSCAEFLGCDRPELGGTRQAGASSRPGARAPVCETACPFIEVLESGSPIVGREMSVVHRTGTRIPVAASVSRMSALDGGAVGVLRDLRAERALDDAKTSFVAAVSHELRTPLALIAGYTQGLLHLDVDATTSRRHLERIAEAAQRLATLVDEIIDASEIETDALVLRRSPVALDGLLRAFLADRADSPDARPVRLVLPRMLPPVDIDATRIRQVVANVVLNAERHAGRDAAIEIRARRFDIETVVISVVDDGRGIAAEDRDHVFERFYRGATARDAQTPGSGLGLYLCRWIVEAHGGWVRLDATTRGTSISVGLPVAPGGRIAERAGESTGTPGERGRAP